MPQFAMGAIEDTMDDEIRTLCREITARVMSLSAGVTIADANDLRTRIRSAITTWRTSDITPVGGTEP